MERIQEPNPQLSKNRNFRKGSRRQTLQNVQERPKKRAGESRSLESLHDSHADMIRDPSELPTPTVELMHSASTETERFEQRSKLLVYGLQSPTNGILCYVTITGKQKQWNTHVKICVYIYMMQSYTYTYGIHIYRHDTLDGGNLAPLEYKQFHLFPHPLCNIVRECGVLGVWSNDRNLAQPHLVTAQC